MRKRRATAARTGRPAGGLARDLRVVRRHLDKGRLDKAAALLGKVVAGYPDSAEARTVMGRVLAATGRRAEAMAAFEQACALAPSAVEPLLRFARLAYTARAVPRSEALLVALDACFVGAEVPPTDRPEAAAREIARLMGTQLAGRHDLERQCLALYQDDGGEDTLPADLLARLAADRLLAFYLATFVNVSPGIEFAMTLVRRRWLLQAEGVAGPDRLGFLASLALQCAANEYAWHETMAETQAIAALEDEVQTAAEVPVEQLLLYALYRRPARLASAETLAAAAATWPEALQPFAEETLHRPLAERALAAEIPRLTAIDADSEAVKAQYEANPYPIWRHLRSPPPESFAGFARRHFPGQPLPWLGKAGKRLLVAGCGTGREPIGYAARFTDLDVLAVDLSAASLAYGLARARELGVERVAFAQADILGLAGCDDRFEVIASQGVLHHMGDPEAGLAALVGLLAPGGLMRLGLYSERGRSIVVRAREAIAEAGLEATAVDMRRFRHEVLSRAEAHPLRDLLLTGNDFYCLSGLRDFLFHVREHRYRPRDLEALLERQGLEFLGFEIGHAGKRARYLEANPKDLKMRDLAAWERFEAAHPAMVEGLYRFWCCRADAG
ncbi:MAG: methyltransferase domain-containing protein [Alphaproteobacteria bacterium]|nr:methyltransferase domain-containing protein [Alphaproteobacteria bacterium]